MCGIRVGGGGGDISKLPRKGEGDLPYKGIPWPFLMPQIML